jgi:Arm DNA-binding domain/Phage integrase, N-terminal SAM-like domain
MRGKITKRSVDALKPGADVAELVLWDSELKGFGVRVQRGDAKSYLLHYRVGAGRGAPLRKLTIGRHGSPWTAELARAEAKRLLGLVAQGKDPAGAKAEAKAAPTVTELAARFLAEHAEAKRKASTAREYRRLLEHVILPAIGKRKVADVTRREVERLHQTRTGTGGGDMEDLSPTSFAVETATKRLVRPIQIATAIETLANRLGATSERAWAEIKSKAFYGRLSLAGVDDKGRLCDLERHWISYILPWGVEDPSPDCSSTRTSARGGVGTPASGHERHARTQQWEHDCLRARASDPGLAVRQEQRASAAFDTTATNARRCGRRRTNR